jgi:hypothetical protein
MEIVSSLGSLNHIILHVFIEILVTNTGRLSIFGKKLAAGG